MKSLNNSTCKLCQTSSYPLIWQDKNFRVVLINDQSYPGYCRVESINHVKEMTDMDPSDRAKCMSIVFDVEKIIRSFLKPDKINLSSLGNITPHTHWHIIPRYTNDSHFPQSIWSEKNNKKALNELNKNDENKLIRLIKNILDH